MVLWVLLTLSLIVWGLSRRSSLEVSLSETYRGKLRSYAAARAGVSKLLDLMQRSPSAKDTLYSSGIAFDQSKGPVDLLSRIETGQNAYASVQWLARDFSTPESKPCLEYGLTDEGGRININAITAANSSILSALLQVHGLSQSDADKLAMNIAAYAGTGGLTGNSNSFMSLNNAVLKPKNKPYENILELLEVDGMTRDIFDKIKGEVTVYGDFQNGLRINVDTAGNHVLQAVANAQARLNPSASAAEILRQAYAARDGQDGVSFTSDDGAGASVMTNAPVLQEGTFNYYRARVVGVDKDSGARSVLEAVIHQLPGSPGEIVSWQRD